MQKHISAGCATRFLLLVLVCISLGSLGGCGLLIGHVLHDVETERRQESEVVASLDRYRQLVMSVDAERLADMFEPGGELSHDDEKPQVGHDAILSFLKRFAGSKVTACDLRATSTVIKSGSAAQEGEYRQTVQTEDGKMVKSSGTFEATWSHQPDGRWLIRRMRMISAPG